MIQNIFSKHPLNGDYNAFKLSYFRQVKRLLFYKLYNNKHQKSKNK